MLLIDKDPRRLTRAELKSAMQEAQSMASRFQGELSQRPDDGLDHIAHSFLGVDGKLYGYDTFAEAHQEIMNHYPDRDREWLGYQIFTVYKR